MPVSLTRILAFSAFFSLVFLYVSSNDPFGIDDAIDQQSRDILYRAFASSYGDAETDPGQFAPDHALWQTPQIGGTAPDGREAVSQDQIVTVYLSEVVLSAIRDQMRSSASGGVEGEEDLDLMAGWQAWRPTYYDHAEMVYNLATLWQLTEGQEVVARKPPAIFFDFIFLEKGATRAEQDQFDFFIAQVADLTRHADWMNALDTEGRRIGCDNPYYRLVCIKAAGGIPLIFAQGVGSVDTPDGVPSEPAQQAINEVALLAPVRFINNPGDYPLKTSSMTQAEERAFRQRHPGHEAAERPTPAALMYLSWCMDGLDRCEWLEPVRTNSAELSQLERWRHMVKKFAGRSFDPISLRWGAAVPDHFVDMERMMTGKRPGLVRSGAFGDTVLEKPEEGATLICRQENGRGLDAFWTGVSMVLRQALVNGRTSTLDALAQPCPYHLEVPYFAIVASSLNEDGELRRLVDANVVNAIFDGRIIVVGARFRNSSDLVRSSVHAMLPGLHGHAMATDNLINQHNFYLRSPEEKNFLLGSADDLDFLETAVMFLLLMVVALGQWWLNRRLIKEEAELSDSPKKGDRPSHFLAYILVILAILVVLLWFAIFQVQVLRVAPLNWISLSATAIGLFIFLLRDEMGDDLSRFLRRTPGINRIGGPALDLFVWQRRYLNLETLGFEKKEISLDEAEKEKDRVLRRLYPELEKDRSSAPDNIGRSPPL